MKANTSLRHWALTTVAGVATLFLAACGEEEVADVDVNQPTVAEQPAETSEPALEQESGEAASAIGEAADETGDAASAAGNVVIEETDQALEEAETAIDEAQAENEAETTVEGEEAGTVNR